MKRLGLFFLVAVAFVPRLAQADGGIVRARESRGPFLITIFTPSEVFMSAPVEVSVMVQDRETNQVVLDAVVELSLVQPHDPMGQINTSADASMTGHMMRGDAKTMDKPSTVRATRAQGANKLLYSADVIFPAMGDWSLHVSVRRDRGEATVDCTLPVAMTRSRSTANSREWASARRAAARFPARSTRPRCLCCRRLGQTGRPPGQCCPQRGQKKVSCQSGLSPVHHESQHRRPNCS